MAETTLFLASELSTFFDSHIRTHNPGDCLFLTSSPKTNSEARAACLEPIPPEDREPGPDGLT